MILLRNYPITQFLLSYPGGRSSDWHVRLELPERPGHLERHLLSAGARALEGLRRAHLLLGALQHRRGELDLLWSAAIRCDARVGGTDASRFRVFGEAVPEVHPPADVRRTRRTIARGCGSRCGIREGVGETNRRRPGPVPARYRAAGRPRQAWCASRAVSSKLQKRRG